MTFRVTKKPGFTRPEAAGARMRRRLQRLLRQVRARSGVSAARELRRQRRDYLLVAERLAVQPPPTVFVLAGSAEAAEACVACARRYTGSGCRIVLLLPRGSNTHDVSDGLPPDGASVHLHEPGLSRDELAVRALSLAGGTDFVLLDGRARVGPRWLHNLRIAAYSSADVGAVTACVARPEDAARPRGHMQTCVRRFRLSEAASDACTYVRSDACPPPAAAAGGPAAWMRAAGRQTIRDDATLVVLSDGGADTCLKAAAAPAVRPRALFVIATQTGGTPQTNEDLMSALESRYDTLVLRSTAKSLILMRWTGGAYEKLRQVRLPDWLRPFPHTDPHYDRVVAGWLAEYAVEFVHVRHLVWHSLSLPRIARDLGIPVIFSFHDFYTICPTIRLVDEKGVFCGGTCTQTPGDCRYELWPQRDLPRLKNAAVYPWREAMAVMLSSCDAYVTTSAGTRERIQRFFPGTRAKPFPIIEHGRSFDSFAAVGRLPVRDERVRILVPGNISITKGARILQEFQRYNGAGRFEFHLIGDHARELEATPNLVFHGRYSRADLAERIAAIAPHLGAVLSIWPETFCHTLSEMWASGLPVAAFDLGAVGERIRRHGGGWLIGDVTAAGLHSALQALLADATGFEARLAEVAAWQKGAGALETCDRMADAYDDLYRRFMPAGVWPAGAPSGEAFVAGAGPAASDASHHAAGELQPLADRIEHT